MPLYEVRVTRYVEEQTADMLVRAKSVREAEMKAKREATRNAALWFEASSEPFFEVEIDGTFQGKPDCEVIE